MKRILITGATGNIGFEVVRCLYKNNVDQKFVAGVRNMDKAREKFKSYPSLDFVYFDFENPETFHSALNGVDRVFLLRPPHISNIKKYFSPLIKEIKAYEKIEVVFLSVQGAEKSSWVPHNKIEKLIYEAKLNYVFLRPSYFMQNITTTLIDDIKNRNKIILPAGKAKFNWIDVKNIGEVSAIVLNEFDQYKNRAYNVTGYENKGFHEVVKLINETTGMDIEYQNKNPLLFFWLKRKDGLKSGLILVIIMLHFIPRFQKEPQITSFYEDITGKKPTSLREFFESEKSTLKS